jgi:hypothetical protein
MDKDKMYKEFERLMNLPKFQYAIMQFGFEYAGSFEGAELYSKLNDKFKFADMEDKD